MTTKAILGALLLALAAESLLVYFEARGAVVRSFLYPEPPHPHYPHDAGNDGPVSAYAGGAP